MATRKSRARGPGRETRLRAPPESGADCVGEGANHVVGTSFSVNQFSKKPVDRFGDLLPLPLPEDTGYPGELRFLRSRRSRQRVAARRCHIQREVDTIKALNSLGGFPDESQWPATCLHGASLARVRLAHQTRAPAPELTSPQAALRQLLQKAGSSYGEGQPGQLVSYIRDKLSLPRDQLEPVMLSDLLPPAEAGMLKDFREEMMLSSEEIAGVLERGLERDLYIDPLLDTNPLKYHELIADMCGAKLLSFTTQPKVQVRLFFVSKKEVFFAQEDVKDFFYRLQIPKDLGEYFALPAIDPELLKKNVMGYVPEEVLELAANDEAAIYPHLRVLPMGFSRAFHLAHEAHKSLAMRTLSGTALMEDRRPAPMLGGHGAHTAMLIYADNNNHIGIARGQVEKEQEQVISALHAQGLDTHDHVYCTSLAESLGVRIDGLGGTVGPTAARDWRLDRALEACLWGPRLSGAELQVLVGHMTIRALINRGLMGILRHCYVFIEECYDR
ncbi:unnamed protein product, partial [Symbiodinium microadriaticum]